MASDNRFENDVVLGIMLLGGSVINPKFGFELPLATGQSR